MMHVSDNRGHLRARNGGEQPVTPLELFFDLVYVFAVTQLSHRLLDHLSVRGVLETLMLLLAVWGGGFTRPGSPTGSIPLGWRCAWCLSP